MRRARWVPVILAASIAARAPAQTILPPDEKKNHGTQVPDVELIAEDSTSFRLSALAGKLAGAATTTVTIRKVTDAKTRITSTVDADGNRKAVTLDGT